MSIKKSKSTLDRRRVVTCRASIEEGYISTASYILANLSMRLGRSLTWDAERGRVFGDDEANSKLARVYRGLGKDVSRVVNSVLLIRSIISLLTLISIQPGYAQDHTVFKSTDSGQTWVPTGSGLPKKTRINALACSETRVFAGTDRGVFHSTDGGKHWHPAIGEIGTTRRVLCLAATDEIAYAGTDGGGVIASSDSGLTWKPVSGLTKCKVRCLLVHRRVLYAGTDAQGIFVQNTGDPPWTCLEHGLPDHAQIFDMVISNERLFAAIYSKGLIAWDAPSERWDSVGGVLPLVLASDGDTLLAGQNPGGIQWSVDAGRSWNRASISTSDATQFDLAIWRFELANAPVWTMTASKGLALAGVADGVFRSVDQGRNWQRVAGGLPPQSPGIAMCSRQQTAFVAITASNNNDF